MDKKGFERRLEAAEKQNLGLMDEIKHLKEQLAKAQEEQEIPDKPDFEMDEIFYYLSSETDDVEGSCYNGDIDTIDFNMFHTEEYAREFRRRCLLIAMMLHCKWYLDRDYVPDWDNSAENKYCLIFKYNEHKAGVGVWQTVDHYGVCFSTMENAQKCADWLNEHWKEDGNDA